MEIIVRQERPSNFTPTAHTMGALIDYKGKCLLLKRANVDMHPLKWGIPAGKLDEGEERIEGLLREVFEESGITLKPDQLFEVSRFFVTNPKTPKYNDFIFDVFYVELETLPEVKLSLEEHSEYQWVSYDQIFEFDLIDGAAKVFELCRPHLPNFKAT